MAKAVSVKPIVRRGNVEMFKVTREELDLALMYAFESGIADHAGRVVESNTYAQVIQTWKEDYLSTPSDTNLSASDAPVSPAVTEKSEPTLYDHYQNVPSKFPKPHPSNKVTLDNLASVVHWQAPDLDQQQRFKRIANAVEVLMHTILNEAPDCRDRDTALECIRTARMFANSSIAIEPKSELP